MHRILWISGLFAVMCGAAYWATARTSWFERLGPVGWVYWIGGLLIAFTLITCIRAMRQYRALTRYKEGYCQSCGYDLRASEDRCPECGQSIPSDDRSEKP